MLTLTIEALETLATTLEADEEAKRAKLLRLCRAYVRILAARDPERFEHRATHHGDEAGHYDSSYPPKQEYTERTGPRTLKLFGHDVEDIATESGYYHAWRRVTTYGGLAVGRDGVFVRANETGTGRVGQFAAYPGDCDVDCNVDWDEVSDDEIETDELEGAEAKLRELAFPLIAAAQ